MPARKRKMPPPLILNEEEIRQADETCQDCGKGYLAYLVCEETWSEAGLDGWNSGTACRKCLARRLGRKLRQAELLCWHLRRGVVQTTEEYIRRVMGGRGY
jgi:hypothetical protein